MLLGFVGLTLLLGGIYATALGIVKSGPALQAKYIVPSLLVMIIGIELLLRQFLPSASSLITVLGIFLFKIGLTYGLYRTVLINNRAELLVEKIHQLT